MEHKKRLIDVELAKRATYEEIFWTESEQAVVRNFLAKIPRVDAVEVVRCKDCKHRGDYPCPMYYEQLVEQNYGDGCIEYEWAEHDRTLDNGFCSMGERKDNGT